MNFPVLVDNGKVGRELYKIRGTPTTLIINGDGKVVFRHVGYYEGMEEVLKKEIQDLIGGAA